MIYYEIDPINSTVKNDLSDSPLKPSENFSLNSRITKIVKSKNPSEVTSFCSKFKNNIDLKTISDNIEANNNSDQCNIFYNENDVIEIIHSISVAEKNFLLEKEFNSIINYFLMNEIKPILIENQPTPNLRRLKTDPLFQSQIEAKLQIYKPIQFDLLNFYVSKRDIGVQSFKHLSKNITHPNNNNNNNNKSISNNSTFLDKKVDAQQKKILIKNEIEVLNSKTKQEIRFLSESDTENNTDLQSFLHDTNKIHLDQQDYENSNSYSSNFDKIDTYLNGQSNFAFRNQSENEKRSSLKRKSAHSHSRHHDSKTLNTQKYHHSRSQKLMEIQQESSTEFKIGSENDRNSPKIFPLNMEDSLNTIIDSSSSFEKVSCNNRDNNSIKYHSNEISKFATEDDCFEIEFDNESEIEDN